MAYATKTDVAVDRSKAEIERVVMVYGATGVASAWDAVKGRAAVEFACRGKRIRFVLKMPDINDRKFVYFEGRDTKRNPEVAKKMWAQAVRSAWRALLLCIRAKLEAVESGIVSFEQEFMPFMVLPNNKTAGEHYLPAIESAYSTNKVPPMTLTFDDQK